MRRGITEQYLHQQRQQDGTAVEDEANAGHQKRADRVGAVTENAEINDGMIGLELPDNQASESNHRQHSRCDNEVRAKPIFFGPLSSMIWRQPMPSTSRPMPQ